ncbi:unnamed protein product [Miscanthus lutarioriparius]|uniref:Uncharacterized protein n=1 Tax=Miscanthus lutarioriparius TaxID=422564 RepID=A0A811PYW5_9POAL|nr:unnamed protein product [Miscanthus lutarioriparius]
MDARRSRSRQRITPPPLLRVYSLGPSALRSHSRRDFFHATGGRARFPGTDEGERPGLVVEEDGLDALGSISLMTSALSEL